MLNILNVIFWFQEQSSVQFGGITSNQEDSSYNPPHGGAAREGKKAWVVGKLLVLVLVGTSSTGTSGGKVTVLSGVERGRWEALELSAMSKKFSSPITTSSMWKSCHRQ